MRQTLLLLTSLFTLGANIGQATTYPGNGNTGFGGAIGAGSLELTQSGTTVNGVLTTGGAFNDAAVIYLDTRAGGITSTSGLTDNGDPGRGAISGVGSPGNGNPRSIVNFPAGFQPDFAITLQAGFAGIFEIVTGGAHVFVNSANIAGGGPYTFDFDFSEVGAAGSTFNFVVTYLNPNDAFRSNEAIGDGISGGNPGLTTVAFSGVRTFAGAPLPVGLGELRATASQHEVALAWTTYAERDNAGFIVERSLDGRRWVELGWVAGFGESRQTRRYNFTDLTPLAGTTYYRLRQRDYDGVESLTDAVSVSRANKAGVGFEVLNTAVVDGWLGVSNGLASPTDVVILAATGQRVAAFTVGGGERYSYDASALAAGWYVLRAADTTARVIVY